MKKLVIAMLFAAGNIANAQDFKPYFSAVVVSNIDSSTAWYQKVLGLEVRDRMDAPERGFIQVNLYNNDMLIELIQVDSSLSEDVILKDQPRLTMVRGFAKLGFTVKDIDNLFNKLKEQHIKFTGKMVNDPIADKKTFLINDPDDNLIQFFEQ